MMILKISLSLLNMIFVLFSHTNENFHCFSIVFNRTTFVCGNQNNRTPHNLSSADFPRVRIKIFRCVKKVFRAKSDDGVLKCEKVSGMCDQSGCGGIL